MWRPRRIALAGVAALWMQRRRPLSFHLYRECIFVQGEAPFAEALDETQACCLQRFFNPFWRWWICQRWLPSERRLRECVHVIDEFVMVCVCVCVCVYVCGWGGGGCGTHSGRCVRTGESCDVPCRESFVIGELTVQLIERLTCFPGLLQLVPTGWEIVALVCVRLLTVVVVVVG